MAKKLTTTIYITENQQQMLKELNRLTKVPVSEYIREGIDLVLEKHRDHFPGQLELAVFEAGARPVFAAPASGAPAAGVPSIAPASRVPPATRAARAPSAADRAEPIKPYSSKATTRKKSQP